MFYPRYNALRCNAALDAPRPFPEFILWYFKQDDAERQGLDSNAERVEPDKSIPTQACEERGGKRFYFSTIPLSLIMTELGSVPRRCVQCCYGFLFV